MRVLLLFLLLMTPRAWAIDVKFGPEFTFGRLDNSPPDLRMMQGRMDLHLIQGQPKGAKFKRTQLRPPAVRYRSPNGWHATVEDDQGVIEVQMKAMTVEEFDLYKADIQDAVFASAANIDHWPLLWRGGGHINISFDTFKKNPQLFRNFIVDCYNHNELFMGVLGYDTHNAISWNIHPERRASFEKTLEQFDHGNYEFSLVQFAEDLEAALNQTTLQPKMLWGTEELRIQKEFAINFGWVSEGRLEIRSVRPQASVDVWVRQIRLLKKRLEYLEKLNRPLEIAPQVAVQPIDPKLHMLEPPVDPQEAMKAFYNYLTEAGEDWKDHRDYLWPKWGWDGEIKKFEKSYWFKKRQSEKCERRLVRAR